MARLLVILALANCARWTKVDTALEAAFVATAAVDWRQTIPITANCDETNPMIGKCGNIITPWAYFPLAIVAHVAIAVVLPKPWRTVFQSVFIGIELSTIVANRRDGYEML